MRLQHEDDLEFLRRVVETAQRVDEPLDCGGLVVERHDDAVDGQLLRRDPQAPPLAPRGCGADEPQAGPGEKHQRQCDAHCGGQHLRYEHRRTGQHGNHANPGEAARHAACSRRQQRTRRAQRLGGVLAECLRGTRCDEPAHPLRRRQPDVSGKLRARSCERDDAARIVRNRRDDPDRPAVDDERKQSNPVGVTDLLIRQRAIGTRGIFQRFEGEPQRRRERHHIGVLGQRPRRDEDPLGPDAELQRARFGGGQQPRAEPVPHAIELRT